MAYVLTSISGNLISAASAGYAPTNSADVSAVASAYQVVSSTSTQLYAGTAFLTSVNDAPVSASRAGNAANAGMANSAYYDGTGRLISSLPDSAAVSSIASSYAESAASGKLDSTAQVVTSIDETLPATGGTFIGQINGKNIFAVTANSAGDWVGATSKQDTLTFAYDADSAISSINGSALAGGGGGATGDYVEKSAMEVAIGSGNDVSATSFAFGENNSAASRSFALGSYCSASASSIALGSGSRASSNSISVGYSGYSNNRSLSVGNRASANMDSMAAGNYSKAGDNSLAVGNNAVASLESIAVGTYCSSRFGYARGQYNTGFYAFMDGTSLRAKSATAFGTCNLSGNNDSAVFVIGDGTDSATGRHDLMTISRDGEITLYSSTADTVGTGIMSSIRAISAAATGGGVDSATVSAIASSYVESGVSSKLDTTAFNSGDFYTTANESGYVGSAYVDSAVSGKMDSSAMTSYALSADVSGTVDLVSTQSANWGGSALALSAGPGISLTLSGNTLIASTDETVLFENAAAGTAGAHSVTLNETLRNFEKALIMVSDDSAPANRGVIVLDMSESPVNGSCNIAWSAGFRLITVSSTDWITWSIDGYQWYGSGGSTIGSNYLAINKVVGINRTAGV